MGQVEVSSRLGLSELAPRVVQSEIRAMTWSAIAMGGVNLAQGVCDTEVPEVVAEAAIRRDPRWAQHLYAAGWDCEAAAGDCGEDRSGCRGWRSIRSARCW